MFRNGRSQAVRLPQEFAFEGDRVRIRRVGRGVLLEPATSNVRDWFATIDELVTPDFMQDGREQPTSQDRHIFD